MTKTRTSVLRGYSRRDPISHRTYSRKTSLNRAKRTGKFTYVGDGSGHRAGESWAASKQIDPESRTVKYSKNSPSFDEGVYKYKEDKRKRALIEKKFID